MTVACLLWLETLASSLAEFKPFGGVDSEVTLASSLAGSKPFGGVDSEVTFVRRCHRC